MFEVSLVPSNTIKSSNLSLKKIDKFNLVDLGSDRPGEIVSSEVVEGGGVVDDMNDVQWPHEENAGLVGRLWTDGDVLHVLVHLPLHRDPPPQELGGDLGAQNEIIIPEVSDSDDETESPVPHGDGGLVAEDDRLAPVPGPGELGEDQTHHEGLDDATQDSLERHDDHGL